MLTKEILLKKMNTPTFSMTKEKLSILFGFYIKARSWHELIEKLSSMNDVLKYNYKKIIKLYSNKNELVLYVDSLLLFPKNEEINYLNIIDFFIKDTMAREIYLKSKYKNFKASSALEGVYYE